MFYLHSCFFFSFALDSFQQGEDCHRMPVTQLKIIFEPFNDRSRFYAGCKSPIMRESFFLGKRSEVSGAFAGLRLNVREVCLE